MMKGGASHGSLVANVHVQGVYSLQMSGVCRGALIAPTHVQGVYTLDMSEGSIHVRGLVANVHV